LLNGVGGLASLLVDPVAAGMEKLGLPHGYRGTELSNMAADALGLDRAENSTERTLGAVQNALGGTAASFGVGSLAQNGGRIAKGVANVLTDRPGLQAASAVTGSTAGSLVRENGGGAGAQLGASIVGSLLPGAPSASAATVRGLLRGGEAGRQGLLDTVEAFRLAGTTPTVAQATQGRVARALESGLANYPGGAGVIARKAEQQAAEVGAKVGQIADQLAPGADPVMAGEAIERGILGPKGYNERLRNAVGSAYGALGRHIPSETPVGIDNTLKTLRRLADPVPGARATSAQMRDGKLASILDALEADSSHPAMYPGVRAQQTVPFSALKAQRSEVGSMVGDAKYGKIGTPERQLSQTYGAMSEDMRGAARAAGPAAERVLDRANRINAAGAQRTEALAKVVNAGTPEKIYAAAMSGTEGGATQLETLMKSLPKDAQQTVAATVIKRMGRAINSQQNAAGDAFSTQTFLSNWNKLSPQAKSALFSRLPKQMQNELGAIARVGANVRDGSRVFANPSGSGGKLLQLLGAGGIGGAAFSGNMPAAITLAGTAGAANAAARIATSNGMVNFLGRQTKVPAYLLPGAINGAATTPRK